MTKDVKIDWEEIGYILSSKLRLKLLLYLTNRISTPTHLAKFLKEPRSRVSTALRELTDVSVVKCLTPNRKKGRLYTATKKGKDIVGKIHKMTNIFQPEEEKNYNLN